jgi:hypothetical protein
MGVVVMAALDMEMAAHVHERLAKMDEAIELMQDLRKTAGTGSERRADREPDARQ